MGDFPWMTDRGTFIINGTERVVVTQLVRSPGAYVMEPKDREKQVFIANLMPARGSWLELEIDKKGRVYARIDRKRKLPVTVLLRAMNLPPHPSPNPPREPKPRNPAAMMLYPRPTYRSLQTKHLAMKRKPTGRRRRRVPRNPGSDDTSESDDSSVSDETSESSDPSTYLSRNPMTPRSPRTPLNLNPKEEE